MGDVLDNYTKKAIKEVERELHTANLKLPMKVLITPLLSWYKPKVDATMELDNEHHDYYQGLIGVLCVTLYM
jgi:hypothetical protein